jgi:hypothetical protein
MSEAPAETPPSQPSPPARPFLFPSRIIVFAILAVALVALGIDVAARLKQRSAFGKLDPFVNEETTEAMAEAASSEPCTPSYVQTLLGRAPDSEQKGKDELHQTYSWQGVFNRYHIHAYYGGVTLATENPEDAEPLLLRLEQSSNYVWDEPSEPAPVAAQ